MKMTKDQQENPKNEIYV